MSRPVHDTDASHPTAAERTPVFTSPPIDGNGDTTTDLIDRALCAYDVLLRPDRYDADALARRIIAVVREGYLPNVTAAQLDANRGGGCVAVAYHDRDGRIGRVTLPNTAKAFALALASQPDHLLLTLETLGAVGLSTGTAPDAAAYGSWRMPSGGVSDALGRRTFPVAEGTGGRWPPVITEVGRALDRAWLPRFGAIGWYWLLPVLCLMAEPFPTEAIDRGVLRTAAAKDCRATVRRIAAATAYVLAFPAGGWRDAAPLLYYTQALLCAYNAVDSGDGVRRYAANRNDFVANGACADVDAYVLIDGGVPTAVALTETEDSWLSVSTFCALTRSGSGTRLMRALQRLCADRNWLGINLVPSGTSELFYRRLGFDSVLRDHRMFWPTPREGGRRRSRPRSAAADNDARPSRRHRQ